MGVFNIGPGELLLVLVAALIIFGPSKLPEMARSLGKGINEFKKITSGLTNDLSDSLQVNAQNTTPAKYRECPTCSAQIPLNNKFCGQCGATLADDLCERSKAPTTESSVPLEKTSTLAPPDPAVDSASTAVTPGGVSF